jgi:hypothetical protein
MTCHPYSLEEGPSPSRACVVPCAAGTARDIERVSECVEPVVTGQATRFYPAEALLAFKTQVLRTLTC